MSSYCDSTESRDTCDPCKDGPIMLTSLPSCAIPVRPYSRDYAPRTCYEEDERDCGPRYGPPAYASFTPQVMITPVSGLHPANGSDRTLVEFRIKRKNQQVSMQWEPFEGSMAQSGVSHLSVHQTIPSLPAHAVSWPILISYRGSQKITCATLDPTSRDSFKIYLNVSGSGSDVEIGDYFYVPGGCVVWNTDQY